MYHNGKRVNRVKFLLDQKDKHYDIIFIGSSRVVNTIIPEVFDDELGLNTINLGIMDAQPKDVLCIAKLLKENRITYNTLFVQLDYYYNSLNKSRFLTYQLLPYIKNYNAVNDYFKDEADYYLLRYLPFYNYANNDSKLGLRSQLSMLFKKDNSLLKNKGFEPLHGYGNTWQRVLPDKIIDSNDYINRLEAFKRANNLNIKYFVTPFRSDTKKLSFIDSLEIKVPGIIDFSKAIQDDLSFKNGYHLNETGALKFSKIFSNYLKKNQPNNAI
ncbi:hypothetical protein C1A40_00890 [Tamlana carrageenivorans]|uniref:SGNH/GDSL hydrolase family protein n=2 Tax=Pseudotamlana carrageenivorans TaxID=2069432 RepID=A0A2I7SDY7_9FLAO|nr:hypothetical protein C1A40_00890 [Tamlana carrageenivorans]